jgi:hypothetical protein
MLRQIVALVFVLGLFMQVLSQQSQSGTNSNTFTPSNSNSHSASNAPSNSNSHSASNAPSTSVSVTRSNVPTTSNSWTPSPSWTVTKSNSGTPSATTPPGPAVVLFDNRCKNHIVNICPTWSDPAGFFYPRYLVEISPSCTGCSPAFPFVTASTSGRIKGFLPGTTYTITVSGISSKGVLSLPATLTITTAPADPKLDPTLDISNIQCSNTVNAQTLRSVITCTWTPAAPTPPFRISIKYKCTSEVREPDSHKRNYYGARAAGTSLTLNANRDVATCTLRFKAYYPRRAASLHFVTVVMGK